MYRRWSKEEVDILMENYPCKDSSVLLQLLPNRTESSIQHKANRLGLKKDIRWWTKEEIEILKANWATSSRPQLLKLLPNKRWTSIRHKAVELGLTKVAYAKYWRTYEKTEPLKLSDTDRGYLAGLIDGEGSITIKKSLGKWYAPWIQITNTNIDVMNWLEETLGTKGIGHIVAKEKPRKPNHKQTYNYNIGSVQGVKQVLEQIVDLLKIKKQQALLVLEFIRLKENKADYGILPEEEEIFNKVRELNKGEVNPETT